MPFWRLHRRPAAARPPIAGPVVVRPIGHVRNAVTRPRPRGWERVESEIVLAPAHDAKAEGLAAYSHLIVVFYMDMAARAAERPDRLTLPSGNVYGILATRSQLRPNHLGVSVVELRAMTGRVIRVRGLDAIDGTAVLDVKPYLPEYDARPHARTPAAP